MKRTGWTAGLAAFGLMMAAGVAFGGAAAVFENGLVTLSFDAQGRVSSLKEKASGRELVKKPVAFVDVKDEAKRLTFSGLDVQGERLTWQFGKDGALTLVVKPFDGGWTFTVAGSTLKRPKRLTLGRIHPSCDAYCGTIANMYSDDKSAVVLRGYDTDARMLLDGAGPVVFADAAERPWRGLRFGLAAGPRDDVRQALKAMTLEAGVPHSDKGGAWALGASACRNSYLMAYGLGEESAPWWIELAKRGGFGSVHLDNFQKHLGHYEPIEALFPKGFASLSNVVAQIHAAGLTADMHTLTDSIGFGDSWIRPEASPDLISVYRYTLAEPLAADTNTATLVVKEKPGPRHDVVLSYIGNGNILQIGTELIQYSGISTNAPWTFTGVKRGALGTTVKAHAPGDEVKYLWQHFITLFAEPESKLGADLYDTLGRILADCGFDTIYLDGIDGLAPWLWRYNLVARDIYAACLRHGRAPLYEDSCWSSYPWWFHSRIGAWDYPRWAPKMFTDRHLKDVIRKSRQENLLEPQMGWWKIRGASAQAAIFRVDDHEYFAAKCAAADAATSVMLSDTQLYPKKFPAPGMFPFNDVRMLTYLGWYDRFRLAKAFSKKALAAMGEKGKDVRLRQNAKGEWMLTPVDYDIAHVTAGDPSGWRVTSDADRKDVAMRVEALYTVAPFDDKKGKTVFDPAAAESYRRETASKAVTLACTPATDAAHGPTLRIRGTNAGASSRGAWARISHDVAHPYLNLFNVPSFGLWVKGDGSGALLNVQAQTPREWFVSYSDNYVTLDFTGWRYFAFPLRERASEQSARYAWPYSDKIFPLCREVRMDHISSVSLWLNEIPAGGSAEVEVSAVRALPIAKDELREPVVAVNGERHVIPFAFVPGEFAELEDGYWTKYDDQGNPLARARAATRPSLKAGANACAFSAVCADAAKTPRAEILFRKESAPLRAFKNELTADEEKTIAFEAVEPVVYAPARGLDTLGEVRMRPGLTADLSFRVYGPIDAFTLTVGGTSRTFPALKKGESVRYDRAFTGLSGVQPIGISARAADARFEFEKNYVEKTVVRCSDGTELPGARGTRATVTCAPFPDRLSAFVWRNWFCVDKARLAKTVGTTPENLTAVATEMGLPAEPTVLPEWRRTGYMTVLRRNWHLLDYDQILTVLDMTPDELRFKLLEEDFLWIKFGCIKPRCGALRWSAGMREEGRGKREEFARILKDEDALDFTEEPRFTFQKNIARTSQTSRTSLTSQTSQTFSFRMVSPYFADYADPFGDPEVKSCPDGLLEKLSAQGVNAVWFHVVLNTLVKDPNYPEFGAGGETRLEAMRRLVARAKRYGIDIYLYVNEPRSQPLPFFEKAGRAELKGVGGHHQDGRFTLCTSVPETRRWLRDSLRQVFAAVPGLGGVFTITMSENDTSCASRGHQKECPRCSKRTAADVIAEVNRTIAEGVHAGNPAAKVIVWNWAWPEEMTPAAVAGLPTENIRLMSVSESHIPFTRGGVASSVVDYSISVVGPGENARMCWREGAKRGIGPAAKVQANCTWELCDFPYLPVMDLVAEHALNLRAAGVRDVMMAWSLGGCPSPNLRVFGELRDDDRDANRMLDRIAADEYGAEAVKAVRKAWTAFSDGFREYPFHVGVVYYGPQQWGPANPLYMEPTGYGATMVGFPYDGLLGWRQVYPPEIWIAQMQKVADGFAAGSRIFAEEVVAAADPAKRAHAAKEGAMFRAETLHFAAAADQARFIVARDRGDRAGMVAAVRAELARAKEMLRLTRADSRFGYEATNHYYYIPQDVREKILCCREMLALLTK